MNRFTRRMKAGDLLSSYYKTNVFTRKVRLDSKGRILLPAEIRRNYGLGKDSEIEIIFSLDKNLILLAIYGQDGVTDSIGACGAPGPGSTPGPDPEKKLSRR